MCMRAWYGVSAHACVGMPWVRKYARVPGHALGVCVHECGSVCVHLCLGGGDVHCLHALGGGMSPVQGDQTPNSPARLSMAYGCLPPVAQSPCPACGPPRPEPQMIHGSGRCCPPPPTHTHPHLPVAQSPYPACGPPRRGKGSGSRTGRHGHAQ